MDPSKLLSIHPNIHESDQDLKQPYNICLLYREDDGMLL